jgi:hypothetical protein
MLNQFSSLQTGVGTIHLHNAGPTGWFAVQARPVTGPGLVALKRGA